MQKFLTVKDTESIPVILLILQIWLTLRHIMFLQKSNKNYRYKWQAVSN
jgi:hypothetical protein